MHIVYLILDEENKINETNEQNNEETLQKFADNCLCWYCGECNEKLRYCENVSLTSDIKTYHGCIEFDSENKTFDCQGHVIEGNNTGYGVFIENNTNITIKNCMISNFSFGIQSMNSSLSLFNDTICGNTVDLNFSNSTIEEENSICGKPNR